MLDSEKKRVKKNVPSILDMRLSISCSPVVVISGVDMVTWLPIEAATRRVCVRVYVRCPS